MLWKKAWLETRWRFLIGLAVLICSAAATVIVYPQVAGMAPMASGVEASGEIGRRIREALELARDYRGYVWATWGKENSIQFWTLFAVLLGSGGLAAPGSGGAVLFTLSLPVSRQRLLGVRAATGLVELLILAMAPWMIVPLLSPAVGESYAVGDALVHGVCLFVGGSVFFSLAVYLSTEVSDIWRPLLLTLAVAIALGFAEQVINTPYGLFHAMSGDAWFRRGELPWATLLISAAASAGLLYAAARNFARRDF